MTQLKNTMDMCKGPLFKQVLIYSLPLWGTMLLQLTFGAADMVVVGRYRGAESVGAVGSTSALTLLILNFFFGLSVGTSVLSANYFGAKNFSLLRRLSYTSVAVGLWGGIFLAIAGQIITEPILVLMGTPQEILPKAVLYMEVYFLCMPALMVNVFGSALLRSIGDTKRPLYFLIYSGIVNIILNFILVAYFGLDVDGVAWATAASQCISAFLVVRALMEKDGVYRFKFKYLGIDIKLLKRMLSIGVPACIQACCFSFSNVLMQSAVNSLGPIAVSGNGIAQNLEGVVYTGSGTYHQTAVAFVSQNEGGGNRARSIKSMKYCILLGFLIPELTGLLFAIFGPEVSLFYAPEAKDVVVAECMCRILMTFPLYGLCGVMDVVSGALRGVGATISATIIMLLTVCLIRVLWVFIIFPAHSSIEELMVCYPVTWILCIVSCFIYLIYKLKKLQGKCVSYT